MSSNMKITVLGAGNGGFAAASDFKIRGYHVTLFELPEFKQNIEAIMEIGGINLRVLESTGLKDGFAKLDKITTDIQEAVSEADLIFVIVPAFGQANIARVCAPYLKDGQVIILQPGNFGGSICFYNVIREAGCAKDVIICETDCMMYATRKEDSTTSWIRGYKHNMGLATFPSKKTDLAIEKVKEIYPDIVKRNNVLETGLSNPNTVVHIPIMLFNIGIIENEMDVLFYREAFTKSIGKMVQKLDEERMSVNKTGIVELQSTDKIAKAWYGHQGAKGETVYELLSTNPIYPTSKIPTTLSHRYITEDVPYGLIPMVEFVEKFGTGCPMLKCLLQVATTVSETDFYKNARSLRSLKLDSFNLEELKEYLTYGE